MRRNYRGSKLLAALLALVMLLCSFPIVYAEDEAAEITAADQEMISETEPESVMVALITAAEPDPAEEPEAAVVPEEEPETDPAPAAVPEEEPAQESEPAEVPAEDPAAEPDPADAAEEEPAAEADPAEIPEESPAKPEPETDAEAEAEAEIEEKSEEGAGEEASEDTICESDEAGPVSGELQEIISNPDTYERIEFTGSVEIELKDSEICYDRDVTLVARVSGADMDYRLVWEANDGSGWFAVASGEEYTFLLTPDIADREYRVVLFSVN